MAVIRAVSTVVVAVGVVVVAVGVVVEAVVPVCRIWSEIMITDRGLCVCACVTKVLRSNQNC